jgi:hypothetical protein
MLNFFKNEVGGMKRNNPNASIQIYEGCIMYRVNGGETSVGIVLEEWVRGVAGEELWV